MWGERIHPVYTRRYTTSVKTNNGKTQNEVEKQYSNYTVEILIHYIVLFKTKGQWLKWHYGEQTRFIGMKATSWKSSRPTLPKCFGLDYFVWSFNYLQPFLQTFYWDDISKCLYYNISYWRNGIQFCYSGSKTSENYWTSV